jgi:phenylacetate-CoA ligase
MKQSILDRWCDVRRIVGEKNSFYRKKWESFDPDCPLEQLPFTTKVELAANQIAYPPYGTNLTLTPSSYTRLHQTSGSTTGKPLIWLDSISGWDWVVDTWRSTFAAIGITSRDRCFFPFSFGPYLGFWSAFEACVRESCFVLSGGGMSTTMRLRQIIEHGITAIFATPTYVLHLVEQAKKESVDLSKSGVRTVVVAGEPGGNISTTKAAIENAWNARLIDHYGLTEVGPVAFEPRNSPGSLVILDDQIIAEIIDPQGSKPISKGEIGELVVTNLGRPDTPLIRYRTGDLVRLGDESSPDSPLVLSGGIIGRVDDLIHVRGNNLYPTSIERVIRRFPDVAEFRIVISKQNAMTDIEVEIEPASTIAESEIAKALRDEIGFRINVRTVPTGTLPRYELKAKRVVMK